ncbi:hypothetical protein [Ammoniphilus sp. 3BR4]|uniref:hypothetical protein n=1 Tax=Ammoniphilus sp. 3BR4 TaxID=3158265 RepID=UPI0034668DCC
MKIKVHANNEDIKINPERVLAMAVKMTKEQAIKIGKQINDSWKRDALNVKKGK